jgi:hypothetical protein
VAMVVVLYHSVSGDGPSLKQEGLEELARLGITSVALVRDRCVAGLVLEGWAFDPGDAPQAACAVAGSREGIRMLHPLAHLAVSSVASPGDRKE